MLSGVGEETDSPHRQQLLDQLDSLGNLIFLKIFHLNFNGFLTVIASPRNFFIIPTLKNHINEWTVTKDHRKDLTVSQFHCNT